MDRLTIIKIGGSVITYKTRELKNESPRLRRKAIQRIAKEIGEAYRRSDSKLLIVHGAGSYGHGRVKRTGIDEGIKNKEQLIEFADVQRLQNFLNCIVVQSLIANRMPAFPCQPSSCTVMRSKRIGEMEIRAIRGLLDTDLVPVLYGVPAYDEDRGCSILSGDDIASHLAVTFGAERIVFGTNVSGVFTDIPNRPDAKLIEVVNSMNFDEVMRILLKSSCDFDATGGMLRKVFRAAEASAYGTKSLILNAGVSDTLKMAIEGESSGTVIEDVSRHLIERTRKRLKSAGICF